MPSDKPELFLDIAKRTLPEIFPMNVDERRSPSTQRPPLTDGVKEDGKKFRLVESRLKGPHRHGQQPVGRDVEICCQVAPIAIRRCA